jgi:amidase
MIDHTATEQCLALSRREISSAELLEQYFDRIAAINPSINAIVTLDHDGARKSAIDIDTRRARGETIGLLAGLPIAVKDLEAVRGMRTTHGSPILRDWIPDFDAALVERLRAADAVIIGKTNTPEFGLGSHTFNTIFGATRNPWNTRLSAGGSSGGAAAAVASGMLPFADGSDFGGSLRNPASFNNLVGLRPCAGRVARYPAHDGFAGFSVLGPIARTAADTALLLDAIEGFDPRDPLSIESSSRAPNASLERDFTGTRIAFSPTLGGLPVEKGVADATRKALSRLLALGCIIEEAEPSFANADATFEILRSLGMASQFKGQFKTQRGLFKDAAIWNIETGLSLTSEAITNALANRTKLYHAMREFLKDYTFLVAPVSQVLPFPVEIEYPDEIAGLPMANYLEWMRSCSRITMTAHPAMSIPGSFTPEGLPVGLQVVGRWHDEWSLLQLAHAMESVGDVAARRPPL